MTTHSKDALAAHLRSVDWYYGYSDDYGVWSKGNVAMKSLYEHFKLAPIEVIQELLDDAPTDENIIRFLNHQALSKRSS